MSYTTAYPLDLTTLVQITREIYTNVGSINTTLGHLSRAVLGSSFELWDSVTGGSQLVLNTDYELVLQSTYYTAAKGADVYLGFKIINVTYETGNIYATYETLGTLTSAQFYNETNASLATNASDIATNASDIAAKATVTRYNTGWVANNDWSNQTLGDTAGGNVTHNLNSFITELMIDVWISETGSDADAFKPLDTTRILDTGSAANTTYGMAVFTVDTDTITVQTGSEGVQYVGNGTGVAITIDTEAWYYKVIVTKII